MSGEDAEVLISEVEDISVCQVYPPRSVWLVPGVLTRLLPGQEPGESGTREEEY